MKKIRRFIPTSALFALVSFAWMGLSVPTVSAQEDVIDPQNWTWRRPIEAEAEDQGFVRLVLTPEIVDQSATYLEDLRIVDQDAVLVPFLISRERPNRQPKKQWRDVDLIDRSYQAGRYERLVLDFRDSVRKNMIKVKLSGENYRRRSALEGSDDGLEWDQIGENFWLFNVPQSQGNFLVDTLDFPTNDFRYLRLTIFHMADDPERFSIDRARAAFARVAEEKVLEPVEIAAQSEASDSDGRYADYHLDLGFRNLPLDRFALDIANPHFYRNYILVGRSVEKRKVRRRGEFGWEEAETEMPWRRVRAGFFHRIHAEDRIFESTEIENVDTKHRYFRLRIFDLDDAPLEIKSILVRRREMPSLIFEIDPAREFTLLGGNPKASPPKFDLARSMVDVAFQQMPIVSMGASLPPADPVETEPIVVPWSEQYQWHLWVALILATLGLGAVVFINLKRVRNPDKREEGGRREPF